MHLSRPPSSLYHTVGGCVSERMRSRWRITVMASDTTGVMATAPFPPCCLPAAETLSSMGRLSKFMLTSFTRTRKLAFG